MKSLNSFRINESEGNVSVQYLKDLLTNVSNKFAKKFVNTWIIRGGNNKMVHLSDKESNILDIIKKGGPYPKDFGKKN